MSYRKCVGRSPIQYLVLGQTSEWTTSEWTNVTVTNVIVDKHQSAKRQRRQTSEWDKRQRNFGFCQTLTFCLNLKKYTFQLWLWSDFLYVITILFVPLWCLSFLTFCLLWRFVFSDVCHSDVVHSDVCPLT